ncbi:MAG: GAF domain-containing sensor histidine kinase [Solirubrobacteraceae bacterium]
MSTGLSHRPGQPPDGSAAHAAAIEFLADVLVRSEHEGSRDDFYNRMSEATTHLASLRRVVIFRYNAARGQVHAVGAFGVDLAIFEDAVIRVEEAPIAQRAISEDRVLEVSGELEHELPGELIRPLALERVVCAPMTARGRWIGAIVGERPFDQPPLDEAERELLWIVGKTAALAAMARVATRQQERARQLEQRIDLAREVHDRVIQRLFGVSLALSADGPFVEQARARCADEVQGALADLRLAVSRPLGQLSQGKSGALDDELERLIAVYPDMGIVAHGDEPPTAPAELESLAQSVLTEAIRNAHKHSRPTQVKVCARTREGWFTLEVTNDGLPDAGQVRESAGWRCSGVGLRLAAFEALGTGGHLEFGERAGGRWQVRLVVPCP